MLKERVTRFKTLLETYANSNDNKLLLEAKLEKHNELWGEFNMIQKIDELLLESEVAERERGVRRCFFFNCKLQHDQSSRKILIARQMLR